MSGILFMHNVMRITHKKNGRNDSTITITIIIIIKKNIPVKTFFEKNNFYYNFKWPVNHKLFLTIPFFCRSKKLQNSAI